LVDSHLKDRAGLVRIKELSLVVGTTSALIHELQKERGLSSGFVAGAGKRFAQDLPDQRVRTDRALAKATETWASVGPDPRFGALEASQGLARTSLAELPGFRTDIRAQALTPNAVVQRFSGIIDRLLVVIAEVPGTSPHPQVTMALIALFNFLLAKEYTGQVRALGSAVCAQAGFEPFQFESFQSLLQKRDEALRIFVRHTSRDQLDRWSELLSTEAFVQWDSNRRILEKTGREGQGKVPDAESWYRWSTAAIDTMWTAEVGLHDALEKLCLHILAETQSAWEDSQENRETLDKTLLHRLERTRIRLWEERRDLRLQGTETSGSDPATNDLAASLVEASASASEGLQRWRRDLDRWDQAVEEAWERSRQAKILSLDASIEAFRPAQIAAGAKELSAGLSGLAESLEARVAALKAETDVALAAQEKWHDLALAFWKRLSQEDPPNVSKR